MALPAMTIDGDVIAAHSYWTDDGSRIVTEATVRTPDGDVVVSQLGGSVDGVGMITMPGPELLAPGMRVAVAAHRDRDLSQTEHIVLDSVKVTAYPPSYVRTGPTKAGHSLRWESGCVFVTVDDAGTAAIAGDGEFAIIDASIATWNTDTASCSYLQVMTEGRKALEVGNDKVNLIKFRDTMWGRPASGKDPARTYSPQAAGITTAVYVDDPNSSRDGAIIDADIEINGVDFAISANHVSLSKQGCLAELQNTLTHELGHLHGLEHPCRAPGDPERIDNLGNAVPQCGSTSDPRILNSTMYNYQECGEVKKEQLSADDIQSICDIYPKKDDPKTCDPVSSASSAGCCSASGGPFDRPDVGLLLAGTTVAILLRRRKTSPIP
jgi:hypothetical protein